MTRVPTASIAASMILFTPFEWAVIIICLVIVVAILIWLIAKYGPWAGAGGGGGTGGPPPGAAEVLELQQLFQAAKESGSMSSSDCERARDLITAARSAGVPGTQLRDLENELDSLCD